MFGYNKEELKEADVLDIHSEGSKALQKTSWTWNAYAHLKK
jgi:hypothetical protein